MLFVWKYWRVGWTGTADIGLPSRRGFAAGQWIVSRRSEHHHERDDGDYRQAGQHHGQRPGHRRRHSEPRSRAGGDVQGAIYQHEVAEQLARRLLTLLGTLGHHVIEQDGDLVRELGYEFARIDGRNMLVMVQLRAAVPSGTGGCPVSMW